MQEHQSTVPPQAATKRAQSPDYSSLKFSTLDQFTFAGAPQFAI